MSLTGRVCSAGTPEVCHILHQGVAEAQGELWSKRTERGLLIDRGATHALQARPSPHCLKRALQGVGPGLTKPGRDGAQGAEEAEGRSGARGCAGVRTCAATLTLSAAKGWGCGLRAARPGGAHPGKATASSTRSRAPAAAIVSAVQRTGQAYKHSSAAPHRPERFGALCC